MHYLSQMMLHPRRKGTAKLVTNPYAMHAAVMSCFPPDEVRENGRVLWRIDRDSAEIRLYILSEQIPSFLHIQEQAGWDTSETWRTAEYSPFLDSITVGSTYNFRIAANPSHCVLINGKRKQLGHVTVKQQETWLAERAEKNGFTIHTSNVDERQNASFQVTQRSIERFQRNGRIITVNRAQFDGKLIVNDPNLLRHALTHGIGRAKGFGMGLLTLAPNT